MCRFKWQIIYLDAKIPNTFTVFVGVSSDTSTHTFVSATSTSVEKSSYHMVFTSILRVQTQETYYV